MKPEEQKRFLIRISYFTVLLLLTVLSFYALFTWLFPLAAGLLIAILLRPAIRRFSKAALLPRRHAAVMVTTAVYLLVLAALLFVMIHVVGFLSDSIISAAEALPDLADKLNPAATSLRRTILIAFERLSPGFAAIGSGFLDTLGEQLSSLSATIIKWAGKAAAEIPSLLFTWILTVLASYFIAMDYPHVTGFILAQLPEKWQNILFSCKQFLTGQLFRIFKGYLIIMLITFCELSTGLWLLHIESPVRKAALIALLDILPLIGTGGILIPWAVVEFLLGNRFLAIGIGVLYGIIAVVRTIAEPKIIGDQTGLPPLVTLTAMYIGWKIAGFLGILIAPMIAILICWLQKQEIITLWKTEGKP